MSVSDTFDVVVIGAGIAGVSLCARLCDSDKKVLLLDKESQPGFHATGRSAASFIPSYGCNVPALNLLTKASFEFFSQAPEGFASVPLLKRRGMLALVSAQAETTAQQLAEEIASVTGKLVQECSTDQMRVKIPLLGDEWAGGVYEQDVFDIEVETLLQGYLKQCRKQPAFRLISAKADSIDRNGEGWDIITGQGVFAAHTIVNAAGAWADEVASLAGITPLGLQPLRRTVALVDLPEEVNAGSWPLVMAADGSFYLKPDAGLMLVSPADEHKSEACDSQPEEIDIAYAVHYLEQTLGFSVSKVAASWAGLRTFAPDRVPVVGFDSHESRFFWLVGQGGHGIQTAPAMAELAAQLLVDDRVPKALSSLGFRREWVSPARFESGVAQ